MKINTRAVCAATTAFFAALGVGLPPLDPANFWLGLIGTVALAVSAGAGALLAFYDKLFARKAASDKEIDTTPGKG